MAPPVPQAVRLPEHSALAVWARRFVAAGVLALAFGYVPYRVLGERGLSRAMTMEDEARAQRGRIDGLRESNALLRREVQLLRTDLGAIERVARDQLGMVKPGEEVFQLEGTP